MQKNIENAIVGTASFFQFAGGCAVKTSCSDIAVSAVVWVLAIGGLLATDKANAATRRTHYITATAVCASPLPQYDATLRKRPLGIANEAATPVFVSCSLPADYVGDQTTGLLELNFSSLGGGGTVNCTLVAGTRLAGVFGIPQAVAVAAGDQGYISWSNIDKRHTWGSYNVICNLPKDIELNTIIYQESDTDDGL